MVTAPSVRAGGQFSHQTNAHLRSDHDLRGFTLLVASEISTTSIDCELAPQTSVNPSAIRDVNVIPCIEPARSPLTETEYDGSPL